MIIAIPGISVLSFTRNKSYWKETFHKNKVCEKHGLTGRSNGPIVIIVFHFHSSSEHDTYLDH